MVARNKNIARLQAGYLFPEINRRRKALLEKNPDAKIISLGIGNTTIPLTPVIAGAMEDTCRKLQTVDGYSGYGEEQGQAPLRNAISETFYNKLVAPDEVFISDGAKCDIGRLQVLFGKDVTFAVQDPSYPVYVDGGVIIGQSGDYNEKSRLFDGIRYMPCTPENDFFPDLEAGPRTDLIYFCNPNNPTGATATREQLEELVAYAKKNKSIIIYDSAYARFIRDEGLPFTIFEIDGAREVALEINSFSKIAGFTGVRLGWSVVPHELRFDDGTPVHKDWTRIVTTIFNGASNVVQPGGAAALSEAGLKEVDQMVGTYLQNADVIREALIELGLETYGGRNAPYLWVRLKNQTSWEAFELLLEQAHVVTTPGVGFGPSGEGFLRFSAFGSPAQVVEAMDRIRSVF